MKCGIVLILVFIVISINAYAGDNTTFTELSYTEPISGTTFVFPEASLQESSSINFQKAYIKTPHSYISVWSMPNPEDQMFTWKRINEFDANNRFGVFQKRDKLTNADGWIRYYSSTDKKGKPYISCLTLVRGNAYALYVLESALSLESCITPEIVSKTEFREIKGKRISNDGTLTSTYWALMIGAILIGGLCKWIFRKGSDWPIVVIGAVTVLGYALWLYFGLGYSFWIVFWATVIVASVWIAIISSSSWSDFFNFMEKVLNNIKV